jgi:hypothetical protein
MNPRFTLVAALAAAVVMFVWSAVFHVALWPQSSMSDLSTDQAGVESIRALTAGRNGVHWASQGVLLVTNFDSTPDNNMGPMMAQEFGATFLGALCLVLGLGTLRPRSLVHGGLVAGMLGFAASASTFLSETIWYGFPVLWSSLNTIDLTISWFFGGLVIAALMRKMDPFGQDRARAQAA